MNNNTEELRQMKQRETIASRITLVVVVLVLVLILLVGRYGYLQLARGGEYYQKMMAQAGMDFQIQSLRGAVLDRNGKTLAVSNITKSLFVDPNNVSDPESVARDIAPVVGLTEQKILDDIAVGGGFVWIKRHLEYEEYLNVRAVIREKGYGNCLGFQNEVKRYYPNNELAASVIGFVGTDDMGLAGIEQGMDSLLKGEVREMMLTTDRQSRPIFDSIFSSRRAYRGDFCKTVSLTIDSTIQFMVEQELDRAMVENNPTSITCIVMNPKTGEVLAMASRPTYNPNKFWEYDEETRRNRAVSFIYEPGSTFKSITAAAALQEGEVTPNKVFIDAGYIDVDDRRIQNWNNESYGAVTFTDIVKNSLNTGFARVGLDLGAKRLMEYARRFGFGRLTGIDLPGEEMGILFNPNEMVDSDIATTAIGQSIAVTPLQLVTAMSAIANGGALMKPYIVNRITNPDGSVYEERQPEIAGNTISRETDNMLVGLLEQVVASGGGSKASVKGYRIAGKTGTAQKTLEGSTGYLEGRYIASFCGFAPVEDPQFTVLVVIDDPRGGNFYGGQIAAPVAGRIFKQLMRYAQIEPTVDAQLFISEHDKDNKPGTPEDNSESKAIKMLPEGKTVVPDFKGLTIREAAQLAEKNGLIFENTGSGLAVSQSIAAQEIVDKGAIITINFQPAVT